MVTFRDDLETFCKYVAHRPPNSDGIVQLRREDRHLEKALRGLYVVASYRHHPDDGDPQAVQIEQFCGRIDPDDEGGGEARATARKAQEVTDRIREAVAEVNGTVHEGATTYTGEVIARPERRPVHTRLSAR